MSETGRRLAAIMFTDMVGFTALTQSDEAQSLAVLERHNRLLKPIFPKFRGREVKAIGDSFLVEFESALDAVNCAVELQRFLHDYNISSKDEWKITLRIGIHLGDVVHSGGDVFGDSVNIASRLQPLAESEGVCISQQVYDQVRNKVPQVLVKLEPHALKGVKFAVDVYRVVMPWEKTTSVAPAAAPAAPLDKRRIAVLPFTNMSSDPEEGYFADGMTEEIITSLSGVKQLMVIARTSVMKYKGSQKGVSEVAKELNVGTLLEGSVRKAGNRVRITAQLIDTTNESHLWAQNYDRTLEDVFAIQSEIAEKVASELKVQLLDSEKKTLEKKPTEDTVAYIEYLQGMQLLNQLEEAPLRSALALFQQAVARDPAFARAHAGVADSYVWLFNRGYISIQEGIEKGRVAAQKALELDPDLAEGHFALARVMASADDEQGCWRELRKALELNPNLASGYVMLADESAALGNPQEMVRAAEKGYQLDPLFPLAISWVGAAYFYSGRREEAMEHWRKTLHLEPYRTYRLMFDFYVSRGDYREAEKTVNEMERLGPTLVATYLNRGYLAALTGDEKTAREMIMKLDPGKGAGWGNTSFAGLIYYALGDLDRFFEYMLSAAEDHTLPASAIRLNPLFEKGRKDPRWEEIFKRSGL